MVAKAIGGEDADAKARLHERLLDIIAEETGVERDRLVPDARIYKDLQID